MTGRASFRSQTVSHVHTVNGMLAQRTQALARDQCALSGISLYGQLAVGIALYLYDRVSTPGYLSLVGTLPLWLIMSLGALWLSRHCAKHQEPLQWALGKKAAKPAALCFALIFLLDAQLALYALTAMMQNVLPNLSTLFISLSVVLVTAAAAGSGDGYALHRLARLLSRLFPVIFLYCSLTSLPYGNLGHLYPLLGHGTGSIGRGALWMCGCLAGAACPLILPQEPKTRAALCEKKGAFLGPQLFALGAAVCTALLSAYLMPVYALARPESLGWRMLLLTHINPSQMVWSLLLCSQMLLMLITLSAGVTRASLLITHTLKKSAPLPFVRAVLFFFLLPMPALDLSVIEQLLIRIAPLRGLAALALMGLMLAGGRRRNRKESRKEAGA